MRHLSATFSVREVARDQYAHSRYSRELVANPAVDAFKYMYVFELVLFHPHFHSFSSSPSNQLNSAQHNRMSFYLPTVPCQKF
jgi:hypothetical protein